MSDVVWAALIAGGVGALGNLLTFLATGKQARVAIETVERQSATEQAKLEAENHRLRQQQLEAKRQNRQGTYHRILALLDRFDMYGTGYPPGEEEFRDSLDALNTLVGGLHLMAPTPVRAAMDGVSKHLYGSALATAERSDAGASLVERFESGYADARFDVLRAQGKLIEAMRTDVGVVTD